MRYMLLIYTNEQEEGLNPLDQTEAAQRHRQLMSEATQKGVLHGAEPLQPTRAATTVRMQNGSLTILDGPFAETKEQLAGYYILECRDLDEAIEWASRIPTVCGGATGCVEIRPFRV